MADEHLKSASRRASAEADAVRGEAVRLINQHRAADVPGNSMTGSHDLLLAEIRQLHAKLDRLQRTQLPLRHAWVKHIVHDFEYDPKVQYKVHLVAMWVWTFSMITVVCLFTFANHFWQVVSVLYLVLISLYANWATDYGAMSAALAAQQLSPLPEVPLETHVEPSAEVE